MSDTQVLYNARDGILAVGFDNDGTLIPPQFTASSDYTGTVQVNCDIVETQQTYKGDDEHIVDFFSRTKDHPEYGILYDAKSKNMMLNIGKLLPVLTEPFKGMVETPHQASMQHRITHALLHGIIGLNHEGFDYPREMDNIRKVLSPLGGGSATDQIAEPIGVIVLNNNTITSQHLDASKETFIWFKNAEGTWWTNNILPASIVSASTSCTLKPLNITSYTTMVVEVPEEVVGEFFVISINRNKSQNIVSTDVTISKHIRNVPDVSPESE